MVNEKESVTEIVRNNIGIKVYMKQAKNTDINKARNKGAYEASKE